MPQIAQIIFRVGVGFIPTRVIPAKVLPGLKSWATILFQGNHFVAVPVESAIRRIRPFQGRENGAWSFAPGVKIPGYYCVAPSGRNQIRGIREIRVIRGSDKLPSGRHKVAPYAKFANP
jgi:hypothetical protein